MERIDPDVIQLLRADGKTDAEIVAFLMQAADDDDAKERQAKKVKKGVACSGEWQSLTTIDSAWRARAESQPGLEDLDTICVRECGAGGDCLFYAVGWGYHRWKNPDAVITAQDSIDLMMQARRWASWYVTPANVDSVLQRYGNEWFADHVFRKRLQRPNPWIQWSPSPTAWKPYLFGGTFRYKFPSDQSIPEDLRGQVVTETFTTTPQAAFFMDPLHPKFKRVVSEFPADAATEEEKNRYSALRFKTRGVQKVVQTQGEVFRGDDVTLEWLAEAGATEDGSAENPIHRDSVGFIVLNNLGTMNCSLYPNNRLVDYYMLLYNLHNYHWKLAGVAPQEEGGAVRSVFPRNEVPMVLQRAFARDCLTSAGDVKEMEVDHPMVSGARLEFPAS